MHTYINDLDRSVGTYLYGRRTYEVTGAWETLGLDLAQPPYPEVVRQMKAGLERDISIGGPTLAARAIEAGLVDE